MNSMTGHGQGEASHGEYRAEAELSGVNGKHRHLRIRLPRSFEALEPEVRKLLEGAGLFRGQITAGIHVSSPRPRSAGRVAIDQERARDCVRQLRELARTLGIYGGIGVETLLALPGIVVLEPDPADREEAWPAVRAALLQALEGLRSTRRAEGENIGSQLQLIVGKMRQITGRVRLQSQKVVDRFQEQLRQRILRAAQEPLDEGRLMQEIVLFASRVEITEELDRLDSHYKQFESLMQSSQPQGRSLGFLAQEIQREVATLGAKAGDSQISASVVSLKNHLEQIREQVQNIE